jgi:2-hydroxychromene-2-carboxylate isomerase
VLMKRVTFYFDFISPYAYLASTQLSALCARVGAELIHQPVLFAGLLKHWGQLGPAEIPAKREFLWKDTHRIAARWGVPFVLPRAHPFNPLLALRLAQPAVAREHQPQVIAALWKAGWVDGLDLSSSEEVSTALENAQLNAKELIERANQPELKDALRIATQDAVSAGVFGVPTYAAQQEDGKTELIWGSDRLVDLEDFLQGKDPIDANKISEILRNYKASAERLKTKK